MAILLPSIDYTNNPVHDNILIPLTRWFLLSSVLLLIWYLNHFISRWKPLKIIAINLALIGFLFLLTEVFTNSIWDISFFPKIFLPIILFIAIQQSFQALEERKNLINENLSLKSETYKAELENLRNQINPHFLFNSLATLQSLIREKPNIAEDYLIILSDFYRTTLISSKTNKVTLVEELNFIESYIFLLQNRFEKSLDI